MFKSKAIVLAGTLAVSGVVSADLNTGLVAYWNFDDCTATDFSGHNHNGTIFGSPQCVSGLNNKKAFLFNGSTDFIKVNSDGNFPTDAITISYWINRGGASINPLENYISKESAFQSYLLDSGKFQSGFWKGSPGFWSGYESGDFLLTDFSSWTHYAMTFSNTGKIASIYINGTLVNKITETDTNAIVRSSNEPLYIGRNGSAPVYYIDGLLDEARIYNRALTAAEVTALYQRGVVPKDNPVFNSIKFIAATILENKIDDAISAIPNMVGFLANHPYFKNTKIFKIGVNGKIGTQLQKQIREKFTGIDVSHMVVDEVVGFLIDAASDAVAKATNNRYYGGATWFLMKQMYSLADAYSTSKNSKGLVPLPVAFLSTQSSLLIEVAQKDIKEFITLQKDFSGAKASEIRGVIIRARSFDLLQFYQEYFRAETQEEKAIILNEITTRQEELLKPYLSGDADHIFIPRVSKIAKRVYADWLKHLPGSLIKEEFEDRARLHALVYYQSNYDTAISAASFIFGTPIFAIDLIREKAQTDEGANNYLIEHGY